MPIGVEDCSEGRRWIVLQELQIYDAEDPICAMRAAPSIGVLAVPRLDVQDDPCSPLHIPCGWRRVFQSCALAALLHAQGGEMQTFFPCSNPACDEGLETLKHEFGTACQQCAWCRGTGGDWRESAEDACL